ncbi:hypothetical protein [Streptomyces sp. NPDC051546]|uniref:hypothetical protein n=1 Tax=Streptomyces sp. NPDC051546 TaxID=3365655 RepID=UPI003796AE6E
MRAFPAQPAVTDHEDPALPTEGTGPETTGPYEVTVFRTEMITFTLRADSAQDAEERYLQDGEESASETVGLSVDSIERQKEPTRPA